MNRYIGDVHLGRTFVTDVLPDMLGAREEAVWAEFHKRLQPIGYETNIIQVGDLFDKFSVPNEVLLRAFKEVFEAALFNSQVNYIFIRGNHDCQRDVDKVSSFDIFQQLCEHIPNVKVLSEPVLIGNDLFLPYHPTKSATELALTWYDQNPGHTSLNAVGHWDTVSFGNDFNLIPTSVLKLCCSTAITGHEHVACTKKIDGVEVTVTGSMQPYSHGEDPEGQWYVTMTWQDLTKEKCTGKHVRAYYNDKDEVVIPDDLGCISLTLKKAELYDENEPDPTNVEMETFNIQELFTRCMVSNEVPEDVMKLVSEKFQELRL